LQIGERGGVLGGGLPLAGEEVGIAVGGVGDGGDLVEIGRQGGELGYGLGAERDAATHGGAIRVVVERGVHWGDAGLAFLALFLFGFVGGIAMAEGGTVGIVVGNGACAGGTHGVGAAGHVGSVGI